MTDGLAVLAAWLMFGLLVAVLVTVVLRHTNHDALAEARRVDEGSGVSPDDVP